MTTVITITESNGDVFIEANGEDASIVTVLGMLEVAKVLTLEQR